MVLIKPVFTLAINSGIGSSTSGSVLFVNTNGTLGQDNANFFWDDATNRLGLGTVAPNEQLELTGNIRIPATTLTVGQIRMGAIRWIDSFGAGNLAIGTNNGAAGNLTLTGTDNITIGKSSGSALTTGIDNTVYGTNALLSTTTGSYNIAYGHQAIYSNTTGLRNVAIGTNALYTNVTGVDSVAIGFQALYTSTDGGNVAIGTSVLQSTTTGTLNVGIGHQTLLNNTTGTDNMAFGRQALITNTVGLRNVAIGSNTLNTADANDNVAIGWQAMYSSTSGVQNTAIGTRAMFPNTTADNNTGVGYHALYGTTTGSDNVGIGVNSGLTNTTGTKNVFIGEGADASGVALTLAVAIGYGAIVGASNSFVLGGTGTNTVDVGIGTTTPACRLHVVEKTLGDEVVRFESIATNDDPAEKVWQNRVATTTAAVTTLHTFAIPASTTFAINAVVVARRTGGAAGTAEDGARYELKGVYKNVAGVATIIGAVTKIADESQAGWDGNLTVSAGNVLVEVTGAVNNDVVWHLTAHTFAVGT